LYLMGGFVSGSTVSPVIVELDGMLWTPVPGARVSAEEFIAARSPIREIHQLLWWNPWLMTDRRAEYDAAWRVCGQWTRAEPDLPAKTVEDYGAEAEAGRGRGAGCGAGRVGDPGQGGAGSRYDPGWAQASTAACGSPGHGTSPRSQTGAIGSLAARKPAHPAQTDNGYPLTLTPRRFFAETS
jgi:hypothetical protein